MALLWKESAWMEWTREMKFGTNIYILQDLLVIENEPKWFVNEMN